MTGGIHEALKAVCDEVASDFKEARRVLSFEGYLELFASAPERHSKNAVRYLHDLFDHYGRRELTRPWGTATRFKLFDLEFLEDEEERQSALIGQEDVQLAVYRALTSFVQQERVSRVLLLHGPNGSAKSTVAACIMRALEHYSTLDQGALYRFHFVFPTQRELKGSIGFSGHAGSPAADGGSYAQLGDDQLDLRLYLEQRDHPLLLLPQEPRRRLLEAAFAGRGAPPRWLLTGSASHKARQVFEALLASYDGDLSQVLRHVQVERYFISRRYRTGAVTLGPELSVDAGERQLTADRSIAALPASLQSIPLYQVHGELVDAAGGLLEFSDLLKRPLDAYKYLQITAETGEVALGSQNVALNCVLMASGNELHLAAFREHPEFESFRGRLELISAPYLLSWRDEQEIYDRQVAARLSVHVAPHATRVAALFAVLTRLTAPSPARYEGRLAELFGSLTVVEKLALYEEGQAPERLDADDARLLRGAARELFCETAGAVDYEGSFGASPRELFAVLQGAAQDPRYDHLSPLAVLDGLDALCRRTSEFSWLSLSPTPLGYHDHELARRAVRAALIERCYEDLRAASGLVDQRQYAELFDRYISQVSYWVKGERPRAPGTGELAEPDERLMQEVERLLGAPEDRAALRHTFISRVAAFAIDHPGAPVDHQRIFREELRQLEGTSFEERRAALAQLNSDLLRCLKEDGAGLPEPRRGDATRALGVLKSRFGYADSSALVACALLEREYFAAP